MYSLASVPLPFFRTMPPIVPIICFRSEQRCGDQASSIARAQGVTRDVSSSVNMSATLSPDLTMSIISDQPDAQEIREEILMFRTITTLLSELPHRETIQPEDSLKNLPVKNRETIKVCDALAQALVIDHEVIAVTASHRYEMDEQGMLHIVAVSTEDTSKVDTTEVDMAEVDTAEVDMPTLGWGTRMMSNVLNFLCSMNPPMAKPDSEVKLPERKEAEPPAGITKETVLEHMEKLEKNW